MQQHQVTMNNQLPIFGTTTTVCHVDQQHIKPETPKIGSNVNFMAYFTHYANKPTPTGVRCGVDVEC